MYLLREKKKSCHELLKISSRIARPGDIMEALFYQLVTKLLERGHIPLSICLWMEQKLKPAQTATALFEQVPRCAFTLMSKS